MVIRLFPVPTLVTQFLPGQLRASRQLHLRLINAILGTTLRWLNTTPTSRIIARCTRDIRAGQFSTVRL